MKKTIVDLAKELNLSISTVSKIVNNKGNISPSTRERVLDHVRKTGYVAMSNARILSSKKSWTIGVIYSDIALIGFEHPFFSRILQSFKSYVEKEGYEIVFIVNKLGNNELTYLDWCQNKKVDGVLIVMGNINKENVIGVVNSKIPVVSTDIVMPNLHTVISDDFQGIAKAVDHAVECHANKIKFVVGPLSARSFVDRLEAFRREMLARGMRISEDQIVIADGFATEDGYAAGQDVCKHSDKADFYIVASDMLAYGFIRALEDHGLSIPRDVQVMGYDDIYFSRHFEPGLTTIAQDTRAIGERAASDLITMIIGQKIKKQSVTRLPIRLIKRDSTRVK